jgi:hypothetical protein
MVLPQSRGVNANRFGGAKIFFYRAFLQKQAVRAINKQGSSEAPGVCTIQKSFA